MVSEIVDDADWSARGTDVEPRAAAPEHRLAVHERKPTREPLLGVATLVGDLEREA